MPYTVDLAMVNVHLSFFAYRFMQKVIYKNDLIMNLERREYAEEQVYKLQYRYQDDEINMRIRYYSTGQIIINGENLTVPEDDENRKLEWRLIPKA